VRNPPSSPVGVVGNPELEAVTARLEIMDLFARYSQYVADHRHDDWASLFGDDGQMIGTDGVRGTGAAEMKRFIETMHDGWVVKQISSNHLVEVDGDEAKSTSDYVVFRMVDGAWAISSVGRYVDELRKDSSGWRFYRRHAIPSVK
jgi:3-phenylpropionate/cinnamic acid dioxygenase small subunit